MNILLVTPYAGCTWYVIHKNEVSYEGIYRNTSISLTQLVIASLCTSCVNTRNTSLLLEFRRQGNLLRKDPLQDGTQGLRHSNAMQLGYRNSQELYASFEQK